MSESDNKAVEPVKIGWLNFGVLLTLSPVIIAVINVAFFAEGNPILIRILARDLNLPQILLGTIFISLGFVLYVMIFYHSFIYGTGKTPVYKTSGFYVLLVLSLIYLLIAPISWSWVPIFSMAASILWYHIEKKYYKKIGRKRTEWTPQEAAHYIVEYSLLPLAGVLLMLFLAFQGTRWLPLEKSRPQMETFTAIT